MIETLHADLPQMGPVDLSARREVTLWMPTDWGDMSVTFNRRLVTPSNPHQLIVLTLVFGALLTFVSYIFLRNQLRPIRRLAEAATAFGKGRVVHYRPSGATEVRAAGAAFLDMRNRIERQTQARTYMLSGISHDLRTPLYPAATRSLPDRRPRGSRPSARRRRNGPHARQFPRPCQCGCDRRSATHRCHGATRRHRGRRGPGRPGRHAPTRRGHHPRPRAPPPAGAPSGARQSHRKRAPPRHQGRSLGHFWRPHHPHQRRRRRPRNSRRPAGRGHAPFTRLDPSRNQNRGGGVGLGLAIVADAARMHGGSLRLSDSTRLGGLRADIVLPR